MMIFMNIIPLMKTMIMMIIIMITFCYNEKDNDNRNGCHSDNDIVSDNDTE